MKIFSKVFIAILLFTNGIIYAQDFSVLIPVSDDYQGLLPPIKAGSSFQFQIKVKNTTTDLTCNVSIDKNSMTWVKD